MRVLLAPAGSHGDVHPFVGLGLALKARGHEVHLITAEPFGPLAERARFDSFAPTATADEFESFTRDPELWHPVRGLRAVLRPGPFGRMIRAGYRAIAERYRPGETVVAAGALAVG